MNKDIHLRFRRWFIIIKGANEKVIITQHKHKYANQK